MEYKIIDFNKIPGETPWNGSFDALNKYEFNQILTYNKDVFFLLGQDRVSYKNPDEKSSSVIYRSLDFGSTFHKNTLGKGMIAEGAFAGKNLFVVLEDRNSVDGAGTVLSSLFLSKDFGETWIKIRDFEEKISKINFYDKTGIASFYNQTTNNETYRYTVDGGKSWNKFEINDKNFDSLANCFFKSSTVLWFISDNELII